MGFTTIRHVIPHNADCFAVEDALRDQTSPWGILANEAEVLRNTYGTDAPARRNVFWLQFRCNDPSCPAILRIRSSVVTNMGRPYLFQSRDRGRGVGIAR